MLDRLFKQIQAVTTALCVLGKHSMCLDDDEQNQVEQAIAALQPFEEVTKEVSTENFVSLSKVIPLTTILTTVSSDLSREGNALAGHLVEQCKKRFVNIEQNYPLAASAFLHPRFKHLAFKNTDTIQVTKGKLLNEMKNVVSGVGSSETSVSTDTVSESPRTQTKSTGIWKILDFTREQAEKERSTRTECHVELRRYSEELTITRDKNPLDWWKTREHIMSNLSKCAKKYLGIVATSVPSERLFSQAGLVVSDRRSCLKPENVEMMLFLNSYLKQK
ncbi:zinc finger BED domain-containing protein 4-like [Macrobrachium rosenbergii]|uniref:zinc finger BED domain-containing protein 4-like n=1 Tax=Macrobrachium rosenbergii TaxID=79674 RepID=UPI0034D47E40